MKKLFLAGAVLVGAALAAIPLRAQMVKDIETYEHGKRSVTISFYFNHPTYIVQYRNGSGQNQKKCQFNFNPSEFECVVGRHCILRRDGKNIVLASPVGLDFLDQLAGMRPGFSDKPKVASYRERRISACTNGGTSCPDLTCLTEFMTDGSVRRRGACNLASDFWNQSRH